MSKVEFTITDADNPRNVEEIGLHVQFIEGAVRGSTDGKKCIVITREDGGGDDAIEIDMFDSWEAMKAECPTLLDFLKMQSISEHWESSWRQFRRVTYFASVEGAEGIYDTSKIVVFDHIELSDEDDDEELS